MIKKILFVCTGNICRSPMAKHYLRKRLDDKNISGIQTYSAGVFALYNHPVSQEIQEIMLPIRINMSKHISSQLTLEKMQEADLILVMEKAHKMIIENQTPQIAHKIKLLGSYIKGEEEEITDPYGCDETAYQESFWQIREAVENLLQEIIIAWKQEQ